MKNPNLKCRYSKGLGDIIACLLHSKLIGWFTYLITGKKEPCQACSKRIYALNILFPIPFWKIYFKSIKDLMENLKNDLIKSGYRVKMSNDGYDLEYFKQEDVTEKNSDDDKKIKEKVLISTNNVELDGYLIKTEIYKI